MENELKNKKSLQTVLDSMFTRGSRWNSRHIYGLDNSIFLYQERDGEQYDPFNAEMEMKMQKLMRKLSPKQGKVIFDYTTDLSNKCSDLDEFYYRMGLRDGLMLKEAVQIMMEALKE